MIWRLEKIRDDKGYARDNYGFLAGLASAIPKRIQLVMDQILKTETHMAGKKG